MLLLVVLCCSVLRCTVLCYGALLYLSERSKLYGCWNAPHPLKRVLHNVHQEGKLCVCVCERFCAATWLSRPFVKQIWNRCDEPTDPSMERNFYAKRLFPCWVMASQEQFKDDVGGAALLDAMNAAVARAHFKEACNGCLLSTT